LRCHRLRSSEGTWRATVSREPHSGRKHQME
jgi:hypothetical protein